MAMYVCPKPDPRASVETTQMRATISMQQADKLPMSDCTGMPDSMDSEAPQLCHAHCSGDRESALSWQGLAIQFLAAHVMRLANSLPGVGLDRVALRRHVTYIPPNPRAGFPPIYLTFQVLRN